MIIEEHKFRSLVRGVTKEEKKALSIRPRTIPAEYAEEWRSACIVAKISRTEWSESFGNPTKKGWPPWMCFPPFLNKRLEELFGPPKGWDHQLKKRLWSELPEFRMTEKEWRPKNPKT